jgi:uncharacterized protein with NAD-binding domain and iron-sulfur cluster
MEQMHGQVEDRRISRRELLRDAAVAGAAATIAAAPAAVRPRVARAAGPGRNVAVLGGGMAGLAVAHELAERGFEVTVYERKALGGKARSIPVPDTATGGRNPLPGEHGFRFFPGFYHHVPDSMRRIPVPGNPNGVWDNLVDTTDTKVSRANGRADGQLFGFVPDPREALTVDGLRRILIEELVKRQGIPPDEAEYFAERVLVFLTSCDERRYGEWEHVSWWDFIGAERRSPEYQNIAARGLTRTVVAAKEKLASTRTIGNMAEAFLMTMMNRGNDGALDRVLNAPTNEAWIDPWVQHLRALGVRFEVGQQVEALELRGGEVASAQVRGPDGLLRRTEADWFVCAMPVERARQLWSPELLRLDPALEGTRELFTDWMNGIQFYLRQPVDIVHGHVTFNDAPWALTALTQAQFWQGRDFARDYGDGGAVDCLSVDISDWDSPGILFGKEAKRCNHDEIRDEVWAQIKAHLEDTGESVLPPGILHSWFLDPAISWSTTEGRNDNDEQLLVNTISSWERRPRAGTRVPNLFLAGDYVQTDIDLATMEGANESGRAAANALLEASGSSAAPAAMYRLYDPPEFDALKRVDATLFRAGQRNLLDHHR